MKRLVDIIDRAYELAMQVQDGAPDAELAEELSGECGEFLALWNEDAGAFGDEECIDSELAELVHQLKAREDDGPNDPEFLGRLFGA